MSKRPAVIFSLAVVTVVLIGTAYVSGYRSAGNEYSARQGKSTSESQSVSREKEPEYGGLVGSPPVAQENQAADRQRSSMEASAAQKYLCNAKESPSCETSMLQGASVAESVWLYRNGFPTAEDVEQVDQRSDSVDELAKKAAAGSIIDAGLYGRRLVNDGDFPKAVNVLSEAISRGSLFSVYEMSRVYASKDYQSSDIRESAAFVRAAYLLGDSDASQRMYAAYPRFTGQDFMLADKRAYQIADGIKKLRAVNGVPSTMARP